MQQSLCDLLVSDVWNPIIYSNKSPCDIEINAQYLQEFDCCIPSISVVLHEYLYELYVSLYSYEVVIWPDLFCGTFVSCWYLPRIGTLVIDMQHYYHTRYPTDDWHLACMFSLVNFSVEVCLVGVFPHSVSIWSDPCIRACVPLMNWRPPTSRENSIVQGVTRFST